MTTRPADVRRRARRARPPGAKALRLRVPRPLVVPARRDRAVRVRRPGRRPGSSWRCSSSPATRDAYQGSTRCEARGERTRTARAPHLASTSGRPADAPDPPLGALTCSSPRSSAPAADLLHRGVPPAARAELPAAACCMLAPGHARGLRRLQLPDDLLSRHGPGDRLCGRAVGPAGRRASSGRCCGAASTPAAGVHRAAAVHRPRARCSRR